MCSCLGRAGGPHSPGISRRGWAGPGGGVEGAGNSPGREGAAAQSPQRARGPFPSDSQAETLPVLPAGPDRSCSSTDRPRRSLTMGSPRLQTDPPGLGRVSRVGGRHATLWPAQSPPRPPTSPAPTGHRGGRSPGLRGSLSQKKRPGKMNVGELVPPQSPRASGDPMSQHLLSTGLAGDQLPPRSQHTHTVFLEEPERQGGDAEAHVCTLIPPRAGQETGAHMPAGPRGVGGPLGLRGASRTCRVPGTTVCELLP